MPRSRASKLISMRSRLYFLPALLAPTLGASSAAQAYEYMTVAQAQALIFPRAKFTPADIQLNDGQIVALEKDSGGAATWRRTVKVWRVSTGGWFFIDQVLGREDRITFALGIDAAGVVTGLEVLVCDGGYIQVVDPAWRAYFVGANHGLGPLSAKVPNISGVTMSAEHIMEGVRRLLSVHALFLSPAKT